MFGRFEKADMGDEQVVKNLPLSGDIVMTRDTTLADGNRIHTQTVTHIYRDSQGRVRREISFEINTPSTGAVKKTMIVISDPVVDKRYILMPTEKIARELSLKELHGHGPRGGHGAEGPDGPPGPPNGPRPDGAFGYRAKESIDANKLGPDQKNVKEESLGTSVVGGVEATGTRVTRTIPAGEIGNEKPIEVVSERWYSDELKFPVSFTHNDPMGGTVTTHLPNLNRGEPDASLFKIPADYKTVIGKAGEPFFLH
jgi:hypothetical protein